LKNQESDFATRFRQEKTPSQEIKIEGVGTVKIYGTWNAEKLIKRLLQSESIIH
jgi:hypothetical protein